ncbi:MAG: hypothetical protein BWY70_00326 [Bacteroidetes bacterium ADurb.Bin408]|nr:MAG: hypothetical protein BWY70_00326 [Bacteroidetes bacterium ADurb.Bin408]
MNEKVLKCLYDIKFAIDEIDSFVDVSTVNFECYKSNILVKKSC